MRTTDRLANNRLETLDIVADSVRLLAEKNDYAFYVAMPQPHHGHVCLIIEDSKADGPGAACGGIPGGLTPLELESGAVKAKLIEDDYDASDDLAEGWEQLHQNLLVQGL